MTTLFTITDSAAKYYAKQLKEGEVVQFTTVKGCGGKKLSAEFVNSQKVPTHYAALEKDGVTVRYDADEDKEFLAGLIVDCEGDQMGSEIVYKKEQTEASKEKAWSPCGCGKSW